MGLLLSVTWQGAQPCYPTLRLKGGLILSPPVDRHSLAAHMKKDERSRQYSLKSETNKKNETYSFHVTHTILMKLWQTNFKSSSGRVRFSTSCKSYGREAIRFLFKRKLRKENLTRFLRGKWVNWLVNLFIKVCWFFCLSCSLHMTRSDCEILMCIQFYMSNINLLNKKVISLLNFKWSGKYVSYLDQNILYVYKTICGRGTRNSDPI